MMCSFFFSHSKKKTFCIKKNRLKFLFSVCPPQNSFERSNSPFWTFEIAFRALLVTTEEDKEEEAHYEERKDYIKKSKT